MNTKTKDDSIRVIRIKDPGEAEYYSDMLVREHYLKSSAYKRGRTIVQVARSGREDVAILTWEAGTRQWFGKRDKIIGWTVEQKDKRLKYCIENVRFLMLRQGEQNLASHILALALERLSMDAQDLYGHDVVWAETFVDLSRGYEGTCYKAAGWLDAGLTAGGHGRENWSKKHYLVKELKKDAAAKLRAPELSSSDTVNPRQKVLFLEQLDIESLKLRLEAIPDFRKHVGRYPLVPLLALIIAAVLAGASDVMAIYRWISALSTEFLKSLGCRQAPSHTTLWRVMTGIRHAALQKELCEWLAEQSKKCYVASALRHICLDGKTLRASSKVQGSQLHLVTMIEAVSKTIMAQQLTDDKSNEIPKVAEMLEQTPLDAQTLVTADALNTQDKNAAIIQKKTPVTSLPSKIINPTYERRLSKIPRLKVGLNRTLRRIVRMDA